VLRLAVDVAEGEAGAWSCPTGSHLPRRVFATADETSGQLYCIPDDNPWLFADASAYEEYATIGHRNPHRLAKDPVTGRLWSEVGESSREEVNVIALGRTGWRRENKIAGQIAPAGRGVPPTR
jgi:glucose/arabinose dehydrogenase